MKNLGKILLSSLLFLLPLAVSAKDFIVKGKVVNEKTDKMVKGAKVRFEDLKKPEKINYSAEVKDDGFSVIDMKVSSSKEGTTYKVTIDGGDGYEAFSENITVYYSKTGSYEIPAFKLIPKSKPGKVSGSVVSKRTGKPLVGASVTINEKTLKTDEKGVFVLDVEKVFFFTPLDVNIKTEQFGYQLVNTKKVYELGLADKPEFTVEAIALDSAKVDLQFKGKVVDFFGGANTEGVEVSIDNVASKTGADGSYHVKGLKIDYELETKYKVKLTKQGYIPLNKEFSVKYEKDGVLTMDAIELSHEALEAPKFTKPEKTAFSLRPKFEWQLPEGHIASIESIKLTVSLNKDFAEPQEIVLKGTPKELIFPNGDLKRLKAETAYFAKVTYTLKRKQESMPGLLEFNTSAMQPAGAPVPSSVFTTGNSIDLYPAWAQDGKTVFFSSNQTDDSLQVFEIFSKATDRSGITSITKSMSKSSDTRPSAGPEADTVSYLSNRIGVNNIWSVKTGDNANKTATQLTQNETEAIQWISCAQDKKTIVYCREKKPSGVKRNSTDLQIWVRNAVKGTDTQLDVEGTQVNVSPDGEKFLYVSDKQGTPDIWMYDLSKSQSSQLVVDPNFIDIDPTWSKDGNSVIYSSNKTGNFDLWIMNTRDGKKVQLTNSLADERYPDANTVNNEVIYCSDETDIWKLKKIVLPEDQ